MDESTPNSFDYTLNLPEMTQFADVTENVKILTQPSIILKGGIQEIGLKKLTQKQIEQFLLMHPLVPRGIEIKANRMTGRGFHIEPFDNTPQADNAAEEMRTLDERKEDWNHEYGAMKIDPKTKKPAAYTQVVYSTAGQDEVIPTGAELSADQVSHLVFDTWGDEAQGISLVQYVHLLLKYTMNIEEAAAEAIFRSGFTQKVFETTIRNEKDLKKLAKNVIKINGADSIILPEGTIAKVLLPGDSQFVQFHDKFMTLIAIRLGIPKPILTLDGTDVNKATMQELSKDMVNDIHSDELKVKRTIEERIFGPACEILFGEDFDKIPRFFFNDFVEGKIDKAEVLKITSEYINNLTNTYLSLKDNSPEVAKKIMRFMLKNIPEFRAEDSVEIQEMEKIEDELSRIEKVEPEAKASVPKDVGSPVGDIKAGGRLRFTQSLITLSTRIMSYD